MRIVIDLQGAQSESRFRGVGRYSLALALAVARNAGEHEIWLLLNGALADAIPDLRHAFAQLVPSERVCVFEPAVPVAALAPANGPRARASELLREHVLAELEPDMVLVTSLFEGYVDDSVTSIGCHLGAERTAAILYDLIPLLNPAAYLPSAPQQDYYRHKIASLKRAGLLLAISDYSRQEALDALALPARQVVAISTAVDSQFHPAPLADAEQAALRQRYGLTRAMLMYAPGGFDARKNIDGLITAFSLLPPAVRSAHQLLVASKVGEHDRATLLTHARRCGLGPDELVLTGYVDDATLIALYRSATLFIFPSKHEGFGLPALEAMACGAPVIGADNTSIPEVIGCDEALFDAGSPPAMATKLAEVLGDPAMLERLRAHGRQQAAKFSWDISARRALRAMEQHVATLAGAAAATTPVPMPMPMPASARKPRLAFVSPLPPERTGIADYAAQLLPALTAHFEIELVLKQEQLTLPPALAALPRRTVDWFAEHGAGYDHILYQFGNSPFHSHMFPLLRQHPGVVVLHDFFLSSVLVYEQLSGLLPHAWSEALAAHGYPALRAGLGGGADAAEAAKRDYPGNLPVLRDASHVIVHSDHARVLARQWYGAQADRDWSVVPLPRAAPPARDGARAAARTALGIRPGAYLVCSFGFIAPTKLTHELVQAWLASSLHDNPDCELVLVGANHGSEYGLELTAMLSGAAGRRIRIAGWTDEADYQRYLQAADAAVQLRAVSRGETSAAVLDCMNYGLPTIVNANGSMAALPDDCVLKLDDSFTPAALTAALETLHGDSALRDAMGQRAAALLQREHSPEHCAALYAQVLANVRPGRPALLRALAEVDGLAEDGLLQRQLACAIAAAPDPLAPRQLLVDVTTIARHDLRTGIERVVRAELLELLQLQRPGWRVEPVYLCQEDGRWQCRYARQYTYALLGLDPRTTHDPVADVRAGDQYYGADFAPGPVGGAAADGLYARWRARGVHVSFVLYDLLPVLRPEFFPPGADAGHAAWLATIAAQADQLVCISQAVADDMRRWLAAHPLADGARRTALQLTALHLGADLASAPGQAGMDAAPHPLLPALRARPSFLMVGTIEPRKGHLQALAAFERLWADGVDAQLVIVGNEGWKPLPAAARRTIPTIVRRLQEHPELGRRLHWLQGLDDAALEQVYGACACLLQPSEGEGFGLPLIEAACRGLPLLARDIPVFREVAHDGASYFSGLEGEDLARAVRAWLAQHAEGRHPKPDAIRWRTWRETAAELLEVLGEPRHQR
ncbi:glycosyltransferase [Rugamonas apoptosis]|uniref:Glycosyltransferase n=1 Tax=Rugamonas apoptosis TaxID=2758570 RepID=A0A7W2IKX7_9BURK|nr:glycosyltransferase [Rugamonas apoptosis]MBA5687994.1 glycosyltransferase [Rugamonas apoptosis]